MQNNPNNEIHTDYTPGGIFKSVNANQLARSVHYDFVITQEKLDAVIAAQGLTSGPVDMGGVIMANMDGTNNSWQGTVIKPPFSIYINAKLPSQFYFVWGSRLLTDTSFIDCSDFQVDGEWDATVTKDMVNIYSAYPYRSWDLPGGFNFWSNPNAPIILTAGVSNNGVIKVGSYKSEISAQRNYGERVGGQVILQESLDGNRLYIELASVSESYVPFIVYANWMTSGGMITEYHINGDDMSVATTSIPGIYQQMRESISSWQTEPVLVVNHNQSSARYQFSGWDGSKITFSNVSEGRKVSIDTDGAVTWYSLSLGVGTLGPVIVSDYDLTPITDPVDIDNYNVSPLNSIISNGWGRTRVLHPEYAGFKTMEQETGTAGRDWYYVSAPGELFDFKEATVLNWYKWHGLSAEDLSTNTVKWVFNPHKILYISYNDLKEGVVYEINIHIVQLPVASYEMPIDGIPLAMQQAIPGIAVTSPESEYGSPNIQIEFYDKITSQQYANVLCYWGSDEQEILDGSQSVVPYIQPKFHKCSNVAAFTAYTRPAETLADIATATVRFVKLNGKIYVMEY